MSAQYWQETLISMQVDGPALSNSTVATSLLASSSKLVLPANYFQIGKVLRVRGAGRLSNIVTTPGTLTLDLRLGTPVVFSGGAMQLSAVAHTNLPFWFEVLLTCRSIGSAALATLMGQGWATGMGLAFAADSATVPQYPMPTTAPAVGTGFDSTVTNVLDCYGTFSVANAGNGVTLHQFAVESLN